MGSSFVGIGERGFWMRDGLLELWLRLLALHIKVSAKGNQLRQQFATSGSWRHLVFSTDAYQITSRKLSQQRRGKLSCGKPSTRF